MSEGLHHGRGPTSRTLVIGIGNDFRGDDGAGLEVARRIRDGGLLGVSVQEGGGDIASMLELWDDADTVLLIDAVQSGSTPGTIFRFDALVQPMPRVFVPHVSSHGVGVSEIVELAQALDQLPDRLIVYGIEGVAFETGANLSPAVERAVAETAERIVTELGHIRKERIHA